jgi:hypothetical protein
MKYVYHFIAALLITIMPTNGFSSQNKFSDFNIAIIDFEGAGVEINQPAMVTDKFRNTILEHANFKIMERGKVSEILKEQQLQESGICTETSCIVKALQLSGVNYLIAGRIVYSSGIYSFSARLIDVKSGAILTTISEESRNDFFTFVSSDIPGYSKIFVKKMQQAFEEALQNAEKCVLFIESTPENGKINIDDEATNQSTPATFENVQTGKHKIVVTSETLYGNKEMFLRSGEMNKISIPLKKAFSSIRILTIPNNAAIYIDSVSISKSPLEKDSLLPGNHLLEIRLNDFEPIRDNISLAPAMMLDKKYTLRPIAYIKVNGVSEGMNITIDGTNSKLEKGNIITTTEGRHAVFIQKKDYYNSTFEIEIIKNDTAVITARLAPIGGKLNVFSFPENSTINITGEKGMAVGGGTTPFTNISLNPGKYLIEQKSKKYQALLNMVEILPNQEVTVVDTFKVFSAKYLSWEADKTRYKKMNFVEAGLGEIKINKPAYGYIFLTIGLFSDVFVGISAYQTGSHYFQRKNALIKVEKDYYQKRFQEDQYWLVGSVLSSAILRYVSFLITEKTVF